MADAVQRSLRTVQENRRAERKGVLVDLLCFLRFFCDPSNLHELQNEWNSATAELRKLRKGAGLPDSEDGALEDWRTLTPDLQDALYREQKVSKLACDYLVMVQETQRLVVRTCLLLSMDTD
jgi:hypothetical protein